jgi:activator of HSP90 ATPase
MKILNQTITFKASPHDVFEALMDSKKHSEFSNDKAAISRKVGGKFTAYGDYITGKNLEIVQGKKIVQEWHASDWPAKHISKVTFEFESMGGNATKLKFSQENIPEDKFGEIKQGWVDFYWKPMKGMLEK